MISYRAFRTGLTFADVYRMLWSADPDPTTWKHKSRGVVLWHMRRIKQELYAEYVAREEAAAAARAREDWARGFGALRRRRPRLTLADVLARGAPSNDVEKHEHPDLGDLAEAA
jgi:hypothetical protein